MATGLCRALARRGIAVAPFKAQNMSNNSCICNDGAEIGRAQYLQAKAAGLAPESAMNPVLLKPGSDRRSHIVLRGRPSGTLESGDYVSGRGHLAAAAFAAYDELASRFEVIICEGAGSPAEINLRGGDFVNLGLAQAKKLPVIVIGDIDRGGVFASLYGTVALLPADLRACVRGFVVNKLRGDPALLGDGTAELERRCGVPTLGVLPMADRSAVADIDNEDSLALDRVDPEPAGTAGDVVDVAALRWPRVSNAGDLDPLRLEPGVRVRWVRSVGELGRPDLVVLPGSKNTRGDLDWFHATGLAAAVEHGDAAVVAVCAGLQMVGGRIDDPDGVEGPPGGDKGLAWLPVTTDFRGDKVLDRPAGTAVDGPGAGGAVTGYRIHHGRVLAAGPGAPARPWLVGDGGEPLGWWNGRVAGTTLHGLFEADDFRAGVLSWAAERAGKRWAPGGLDFAAARRARLDAVADLLEAHLDLDRLAALIAEGAP